MEEKIVTIPQVRETGSLAVCGVTAFGLLQIFKHRAVVHIRSLCVPNVHTSSSLPPLPRVVIILKDGFRGGLATDLLRSRASSRSSLCALKGWSLIEFRKLLSSHRG